MPYTEENFKSDIEKIAEVLETTVAGLKRRAKNGIGDWEDLQNELWLKYYELKQCGVKDKKEIKKALQETLQDFTRKHEKVKVREIINNIETQSRMAQIYEPYNLEEDEEKEDWQQTIQKALIRAGNAIYAANLRPSTKMRYLKIARLMITRMSQKKYTKNKTLVSEDSEFINISQMHKWITKQGIKCGRSTLYTIADVIAKTEVKRPRKIRMLPLI